MGTKSEEYSLRTKTSRSEITPHHDPYWEQIHQGLHLGYRKAPSGAESWMMRCRVEKDGRKSYRSPSLGPVTDLFDYKEAKLAAIAKEQDWKEEGAPAPREERGVVAWTVQKLINEYVDAIKGTKPDPEDWAKKTLIRTNNALSIPTERSPDKEPRRIASTRLRELRSGDIKELQRELLTEMKGSSVNRTLAPIVAAIRWVIGEKDLDINPLGNYKRATTSYVEKPKRPLEECARVAQNAPGELSAILTCMFYTGCRPVGARRLKVADLDLETGQVWFTSRKGKGGEERRYYTSLNDQALAFFRRQVEGKAPGDYVFTTGNDLPWSERNLAKAFDGYRESAELVHWPSMYVFRHSTITAALQAGMPAVQASQEFDTGLDYLQKHYFGRSDELARQFLPSLEVA